MDIAGVMAKDDTGRKGIACAVYLASPSGSLKLSGHERLGSYGRNSGREGTIGVTPLTAPRGGQGAGRSRVKTTAEASKAANTAPTLPGTSFPSIRLLSVGDLSSKELQFHGISQQTIQVG